MAGCEDWSARRSNGLFRFGHRDLTEASPGVQATLAANDGFAAVVDGAARVG